MALSDKMKKYAKAKALGIEGYRSLSDADLDAAIAAASPKIAAKGKVSQAPVKGKSSAPKGKATPRPTTPESAVEATPTPEETKTKTRTAPAAKSTRQKSSPAKATAATGKATRQSAPTKRPVGRPRKTTKLQPGQPIPVNLRKKAKVSKTSGERHLIDKSALDWQAETNVGKTGKRAAVLNALRKYKGNYEKVFELLQPHAKEYYKGKTKAEAEHLLRWLIARVAFDFAMNTGQHEPGSRRAYGTAGTNGSTPKGKAAAAVKKATGTRRTATKPATKARTAPAVRKPVQKRTAARGKATAKR